MRGAPLALAVGGLAVLVVGLLAGRAAWIPQPAVGIAEHPSQEQDVAVAPQPPRPAMAEAPTRARPVGSDLVAIPPVEPETLMRVEPREPLSPFGRPLPPPRRDNSRIYRPVADAAGRILGDGLLVDITGVDIIEPETVCTNPDGVEWPCGMRARTAFRGLLRGRAVSCDVPPDYDGAEITAGCTLGRLDLGAWIVANGWGRAAAGGPYEEQELAAREAEKGIFGFGPAPMPVLTAPFPNFMDGG
ncbi:MAG: thermonuclease family protein [Rhizobiaceae bacterium]